MAGSWVINCLVKLNSNWVRASCIFCILFFMLKLMKGKVCVPLNCQDLCKILVETNKIEKTCLFDTVSFFYSIVPDSSNLA